MKYFIRSLKYFVALCVLCAAIMALNRLSGFATLTLEETFYVMFHTCLLYTSDAADEL